MKVDPRFLSEEGPQIFTGNELLLKGVLETEGGVHLLGGYPGSPISGFFDAMAYIKDLLIANGVRAVINNNEALAVAMLNGSQVAGCRGMIVMKSVGVHVASDALALGNLAGAHPDGGAVVIYGDDPWSDSTQVPSDSRYISKHLQIPVIEPSTLQEVKDYVNLSFKLSAEAELYAGFMLTNNLADGGGTVQCHPNRFTSFGTDKPKDIDTSAIDLDKFVLLPPRTWWQEASLPARFAKAIAAARRLGLNRIDSPSTGRRPIGFIAAGLGAWYLQQSLEDLGLLGRCPVLKLGMTYPVDPDLVRELASQCERIVVIEERRGFMEEQVAEIILNDRQCGRLPENLELWGKNFPNGLEGIPATRGLLPSIITERIGALLKSIQSGGVDIMPLETTQTWDRELKGIQDTARKAVPKIPARIPSFCPGCPHRDSASLCLEIKRDFMKPQYMKKHHNQGTVDLLFHGDIGCYTMLMFPPNSQLMHNLSGMGLGGGTGSGMDPFITNKQAVFMGDSTFFHSGVLAISQAIKLGQDITFIILDNRTTAMTGHQPTPGVEYDLLGQETPVQDIEDVINGLGGGQAGFQVMRVDPEQRKEYRRLLEQTFLADGVKVIIADKECGITRGRRNRRAERQEVRDRGYLSSKEYMNINSEICRFCLACAELTGCPGLHHVGSDYGPKMDTDVTSCVVDGACERIGACSSFEHVTVKRKRPPRTRLPELGLDDIPEPQTRPLDHNSPGWRCCLAGVGGMGIGVATSIIVRAGHKEGFEVTFVDKKGLAVRNGGVFSQVIYNTSGHPVTALIPYGKADLLIGVDILEAVRALDPTGRTRIASPDKTAAVINTNKIQTISGVIGTEDFDPDELERVLRANTRSDDYLARNISHICEKYLGNRMYTNIMMLGFAFQKGFIPVSMHSMAWAIKDTIRTDFKKNLYAFNIGRKLVVRQDLFQGPPAKTSWRDVLEERCRWAIRRFGAGDPRCDELRTLAAGLIRRMNNLDKSLKRDVIIRIYDCMRWGGMQWARRYATRVRETYEKDSSAHGYAATGAVIRNLAAAMLIKDMPFISELATSPEKHARDRRKYNVNTANGDRIRYRHLLHQPVTLWKWTFRMNLTVSHFTLEMIKRMRWLRKLPGWNRDALRDLDQYERIVDAFAWETAEDYRRRLTGLSSALCISCDQPRCRESGCPLANDIPGWIELAVQGKWREASEKLHSTNNFPEFTAEICPAPCQSACKRLAGGFPVQIRDVEKQIIERAFLEGWVTPSRPAIATGRRVAVIGSGPAGLAAAQQLARKGHDATVFETEDQPGGLLRYGIPQFRLDKVLLDRRLDQLREEGITFRTATRVGVDISARDVLDEFDAVCLATGALTPRDLDVPGRRNDGVFFALDYLRSQIASAPKAPTSAKGKTVAVLGGGETGNDCVETALLQGAKGVYQLEIMPESNISGDLTHTTPEGVKRRYCVATRSFETKSHGLSKLSGVEVTWSQTPAGPVCEDVPDSEFTLSVDMVVLALGYKTVADVVVAEQLGLKLDERGAIIGRESATSVKGVYIAGDAASGPSLVATAIASGRQAAQKIDEYLKIRAT